MTKQLYYAPVYSYLSYGIMVWGCASNSRLNYIRTRQNKCLRSIFFAHSRESVGPYYKLLEILKLESIYALKISCFTHNIWNNTDSIPDVFSNVLTPVSNIHKYNTRFANNLNFFRPRVSTNVGKSSFKFSRSKIWESVPSNLKNNIFKREYKYYLLSNQIWSWFSRYSGETSGITY